MSDGFCECGCGQRTPLAKQTAKRNGYVKGKPVRFLKGHHTRKSPIDFVEDPTTHCWIWQGGTNDHGYGRTAAEGRMEQAHRWYFEALVGPIPDGLTIDHLCGTKLCVNPGHLEPVPFHVNNARSNSPSARNARKTHCVRGHLLSGDNLYVNPKGNRECRICRSEAARQHRERKLAA